MATAKKQVQQQVKKPTPAKRPNATSAKKPAAPKHKREVQQPVQEQPQGPQIPYHFVVTFEKEGGERVNADGILAMPVPILNQETYNAVKGLLAEHFKVENVKAVLISSLTRMDGVQLLMQPVQAQ